MPINLASRNPALYCRDVWLTASAISNYRYRALCDVFHDVAAESPHSLVGQLTAAIGRLSTFGGFLRAPGSSPPRSSTHGGYQTETLSHRVFVHLEARAAALADESPSGKIPYLRVWPTGTTRVGEYLIYKEHCHKNNLAVRLCARSPCVCRFCAL